jgi:uncharacterized protein YwqG
MAESWESLEEYRERLAQVGLAAYLEALVNLARPSARLLLDAEGSQTTGASRLGGLPDLPSSTRWPHCAEKPLNFIAQIDLADTSPHDTEHLAPSDGLLSFFYDAEAQPWGFDPADRGSAVVIYTPASAQIEPRRPPASLACRTRPPNDYPPSGVYSAIGLRARSEMTYAPPDSFDVQSLGLSEAEVLAYAEVHAAEVGRTAGGGTHRLLGHPDSKQGDMQVECQLVTNGYYFGGGRHGVDPQAMALLSGASEWRLLLQVDTQDDVTGMMWGDCGRLFYWIREPDLRARNWDRIWPVLQC